MYLTSSTYSGRVLGKSLQVNLPANAVMMFTGNNPAISDEITNRLVKLRFNANDPNPQLRSADQFTIPNIEEYASKFSFEQMSAWASIIRHWSELKSEGQETQAPTGALTGAFATWGTLVGSIIATCFKNNELLSNRSDYT